MFLESVRFITDSSITPQVVSLPDTVGIRTRYSTRGREVIILGNDNNAMTEAVRTMEDLIARNGGLDTSSHVLENPSADEDGYRYLIILFPHGMISLALPEAV